MTHAHCLVCGGSLDSPGAHLACAARPSTFELPERIGPYVIRRKIGAGGMGSVYAGLQHCPAREVAIKVIKDGIFADEVLRERFLLEREIAGSFGHPNIVRVYDAGSDEDGELYYVMELAERGTLREYLRTESLSVRDAVRLMIEVSFAVDHAHSRGVRHRDLKPDNILIGADRRPRVTDFGVALQLAEHVDPPDPIAPSTLVGSYPYMAPEQAGYRSSSDPGTAADVYSLGAIMYELVRGTPAYPAQTRDELFAALGSGPPAPLHDLANYDLEAVIMKALEQDPSRRYPSAAAFAEDLRRTLGRRTPIARPRSLRGRLVSALSHHAAWLSILVAALTISLSSFASVEQREQTHVSQQTQRAAGTIAQIFAHAATVTQQLAHDPMTLATFANEPTGRLSDESWLGRIAGNNKLINSAFLLTTDGRPVAHYPPEPDGYYRQHFKDRTYFPGARLATLKGTDLGAFVSPLFRSRASDKLIKLAFSAPVADAQQPPLGVAVVTVALEKLIHEIDQPLRLIAPCERELIRSSLSDSLLVRIERGQRGVLVLEPIDGRTRRTIKSDVAGTPYQIVAETGPWAAFARRDGPLLGMLPLLCLCALTLFLLRRARVEAD
ncbi:MAG TPA: protein kinase [Polyangiales bacterium]|nr:protein kinase [Polyangiales bacterium]